MSLYEFHKVPGVVWKARAAYVVRFEKLTRSLGVISLFEEEVGNTVMRETRYAWRGREHQ